MGLFNVLKKKPKNVEITSLNVSLKMPEAPLGYDMRDPLDRAEVEEMTKNKTCIVHNLVECEECGNQVCTNCDQVYLTLPDREGKPIVFLMPHPCTFHRKIQNDLRGIERNLKILRLLNLFMVGLMLGFAYIDYTSGRFFSMAFKMFLAGVNLTLYLNNRSRL